MVKMSEHSALPQFMRANLRLTTAYLTIETERSPARIFNYLVEHRPVRLPPKANLTGLSRNRIIELRLAQIPDQSEKSDSRGAMLHLLMHSRSGERWIELVALESKQSIIRRNVGRR